MKTKNFTQFTLLKMLLEVSFSQIQNLIYYGGNCSIIGVTNIHIKTLLMLLAFSSIYFANAQVLPNKNQKVYKTWVRLDNTASFNKGILREVGDSSIFVSQQLSQKQITEYNFRYIDLIKVQRDKSVRRGIITGSVIGLGSSVILSNSILGGTSVLSAPIAVMLGLTYGLVGAGLGALAGTVKDRIAIKSDFKNFEKYKANLQDYSFTQEDVGILPKFKHRWFGGFTLGLSFPFDEFIPYVPIDDYTGMRRIGHSERFSVGYRFNNSFGITISNRSNMFNLLEDYAVSYWGYDIFMVGPVISLPVSKRLSFEMNPNAGYSTAYLMGETDELIEGSGFGLDISGAIVYNNSKRWNISMEAGYNSSNQDYSELGKGNVRALNLGLGMAYKFGKKSL